MKFRVGLLINKYVRLWGQIISTHANPTRGQRTGWISQQTGHAHVASGPDSQHVGLRSGRLVPLWASGGASVGTKFLKMWDCLPRMLMNHHEKFHATSFILNKEILNHTDTHTKLQKTNKYNSGHWPISTHADQRPHTVPYSTNGTYLAWHL